MGAFSRPKSARRKEKVESKQIILKDRWERSGSQQGERNFSTGNIKGNELSPARDEGNEKSMQTDSYQKKNRRNNLQREK